MSEKEVFSIDLDNKEFIKGATEALKSLGEIGESNTGLKKLVGTFLEVGKAASLLGAAVLVVKASIEETFRAERIEQVNRQFDLLTQAAGIAGGALKAEMLKASDGLLSVNQATDLANKAIVRLGESSERIPEIMELSRKIGTVTGHELTEVFTSFSEALASGSARALRQYGIIVDQKKAVEEYAKSIGVSTSALTRQGEIQAVINAALAEGEKRYGAVTSGSDHATESYEKLKASLSGLKDTIAGLFSASAGWSKIFDSITEKTYFLIDAINKLQGKTTASTDQINYLELHLKSLEDQMAAVQKQSELPWFQGGPDTGKVKLEALQKEIDETHAQLDALKSESDKVSKDAKAASASAGTNTDGLVDRDKQLKEEQKLQEQLLNIRSQSLEMQKTNAQDETQIATIVAEQKTLLEQQFQLKKEELEREARERNVNNAEQIVELEAQKNLRLQQLDQQLYDDRVRALDNYQRQSQNTAQGVARAFEVQSKQSAMDLQKGIALGNSAVNAFSKNSTNALLAFGAGTKTAGEAFKGFLFGAIADTAQAFGEQMILASIFPPNPIGLAAGGGLIALAGFLRSQSKGASDFGGGSFGGGGGGSAAGVTGPDNSTLAKQDSKAVSITVQGSYFETEQTRTRLVDMIRESSDFTDFSFRQIGK